MTSIVFGDRAYLWLMLLPAALLLVWSWRFARRRGEIRQLFTRRVVPVRERFQVAGDLAFWLWLPLSLACLVTALARPQLPSSTPRRPGADLVVLQDASASMHVADIRPNRWERSMEWLRALGDALSWRDDRIALTVFAHIAAPQIRLTRDPNTLFFFLDHLQARPPFRLEDDTTWDTNLELAIGWGLRLIDKDEEIHGPSANARALVMLSDGETWSGEVAQAIATIGRRGIPLYVIGVGTLGGARLPRAATAAADGEPAPPEISRLDRAGLQRIAAAAGGQYFELDRDGDRIIASTIVSSVRRLAPPVAMTEQASDLYWWFLAAASAFAALGLLFLREPVELAIVLATGIASAGLLYPIFMR